jgi:Zn-finger nucleic acid-binding protein
MKCPRDGASLSEIKIDEIVLDRCPICGGTWFDFGQLERALSRESRALRRLLLERGSPRMPAAEILDCPRCSDVLIRMRADRYPIDYYSCLTCYGRWVDGYEMHRLVGRSLAIKFERLFERLLR